MGYITSVADLCIQMGEIHMLVNHYNFLTLYIQSLSRYSRQFPLLYDASMLNRPATQLIKSCVSWSSMLAYGCGDVMASSSRFSGQCCRFEHKV